MNCDDERNLKSVLTLCDTPREEKTLVIEYMNYIQNCLFDITACGAHGNSLQEHRILRPAL